MALTRKFLTALGIEPEKVDEIITAHRETVDALKEERDTYKQTADNFEEDAKRLKDVEKELDDLKQADANSVYKTKFEELEKKYNDVKGEYDGYKAEVAAKETKAKKQAAYRSLLKDAGISEKRLDAVLRVSDLEKVELDDDGKIKDADKLTESVKTDWEDFIVTPGAKGAETPPAGLGGTGGASGKGESRAAKLAAQYHANLYGEAPKSN